jgi:uncharacterized membrane protein
MQTTSGTNGVNRFSRFGLFAAAVASLVLLTALPAMGANYKYTIMSHGASYITNNEIIAGGWRSSPGANFIYIGENYTFLNMSVWGINSNGTAAGSGPGGGAVVYQDGSYTELPLPEGWTKNYTWATGINDNGAVVGKGGNVDNPATGFLYCDEAYTTIKPPGNWTNVSDLVINNNGVIAGMGREHFGDNYKSEGFLYNQGEYTTILPTGFNSISAISDINEGGAVVGTGFASNPDYPPILGFLYNGGASVPIFFPGWKESHAVGINNHGDVVGWGSAPNGVSYQSRGFVYRGGIYQEIIPPGWQYAYAEGINDSGVIVGYGKTGDSYLRGFIATPKGSDVMPGLNLLLGE